MTSIPRISSASINGSPVLVTLDNFEDLKRPINSPRSIEVCRENGIEPSELNPRSIESFIGGGGNLLPEFVQRRYEHFEERRKVKLADLRAQRNKKLEAPPSTPAVSTPRIRTVPVNAASYSPARAAVAEFTELQRLTARQIELTREENNAAKLDRLRNNIQAAAVGKERQDQTIRGANAEKWTTVIQTHAKAQDQELSRHRQHEQRAEHNDNRRESARFSARSKLHEKVTTSAEQNDERIRSAQLRSEFESAKQNQHHANHWQKVEDKAKLAQEKVEQLKLEVTQQGIQHEQEVIQAHAKAEERAARRHSHFVAKAERKEDLLDATERRRLQLLQDLEAKSAQAWKDFAIIRDRAQALESDRIGQKRDAVTVNECKIEAQRCKRAYALARELERKRQEQQDRMEEVTRQRRAKEYKKSAEMRDKLIRTGTLSR